MFLRKRLLFKPYFRGYTGRILLIEVKTFFKLVWITISFVLTALPFTKIRYYLLVVTVINVFVCHVFFLTSMNKTINKKTKTSF